MASNRFLYFNPTCALGAIARADFLFAATWRAQPVTGSSLFVFFLLDVVEQHADTAVKNVYMIFDGLHFSIVGFLLHAILSMAVFIFLKTVSHFFSFFFIAVCSFDKLASKSLLDRISFFISTTFVRGGISIESRFVGFCVIFGLVDIHQAN